MGRKTRDKGSNPERVNYDYLLKELQRTARRRKGGVVEDQRNGYTASHNSISTNHV